MIAPNKLEVLRCSWYVSKSVVFVAKNQRSIVDELLVIWCDSSAFLYERFKVFLVGCSLFWRGVCPAILFYWENINLIASLGKMSSIESCCCTS